MARPPLPHDDLYARLELPTHASPEAIEIAWRALLKRHHPDVAGDGASDALERAKRINVAHDWLSDPALRARYDRERSDRGRPSRSRPTSQPRPRPRPRRPRAAFEAFLERVGRLTKDEVDRLAMAEPTSIAFAGTIRRFLPAEPLAALDAAETAVDALLEAARQVDVRTREGILAAASDIVLSSFLDAELSAPFRERLGERLTRAWDAAIGQPRYGPNTRDVSALVDRVGRLTGGELRAIAAAAPQAGAVEPWPSGVTPEDDEVLRVSTALAVRDAVSALPASAADRRTMARAARHVARAAHLTVLRPAYRPREWSYLLRPWFEALGEAEPAGVAPVFRMAGRSGA